VLRGLLQWGGVGGGEDGGGGVVPRWHGAREKAKRKLNFPGKLFAAIEESVQNYWLRWFTAA